MLEKCIVIMIAVFSFILELVGTVYVIVAMGQIVTFCFVIFIPKWRKLFYYSWYHYVKEGPAVYELLVIFL